MDCLKMWSEPVIPVQHLSNSGITRVPDPLLWQKSAASASLYSTSAVNIPVIDMQHLYSDDPLLWQKSMELIDEACREWGFFQVVNHGVSHELMTRTREAWREFFELPLEEKKKYANSPGTYEGYGSRLGVEKEISLDWSDYFYLHFLPMALRDKNKWPSLPVSCRELTAEYGKELVKLGGKLMKILSTNLGLEENYLQEAFGGDEISACIRVYYFPKCPQPDLTLGLSSHSDPGCLTLLFPDENVSGLQVRRGDQVLTVDPIPNAFIIKLADQLQVVSNAKYKSVEHRVIVNSVKDRVSLVFFYNPKTEILVKPAAQLVSEAEPPLYPAMTFDEYRLHNRIKGLTGKTQVESLAKPNQSYIRT